MAAIQVEMAASGVDRAYAGFRTSARDQVLARHARSRPFRCPPHPPSSPVRCGNGRYSRGGATRQGRAVGRCVRRTAAFA